MLRAIAFCAMTLVCLGVVGCMSTGARGSEVVVYTSVDQKFSEPVLDAFAEETGIEVKPVFDVEAAKTTGLVHRLIAEKQRPQADVWWNGEFAQTVDLAREGVLAPYASPNAADLPEYLVDPEHLWTGFGGRSRVLLVNTDRLSAAEYPDSIYDLATDEVSPELKGMAYPLFGTTATHAAALYELLGPARALEYYESVADSGVRVVDGNSVVRDQVASGQLAYGITDTDDACGAVERGAPVALVFPDQGPDEIGTFVIPNTVAIVAGGPNPESARALVDHLLAPDTTADLIESGWFQLPMREVDGAVPCVDASQVKAMEVPLADVAAWISTATSELAEVFAR